MKKQLEQKNKAYKFRLYPNKNQQMLLVKTFGCVRFIYNRMLSDKIAHYEKTGKDLYCYPSQYKQEYPWLKEVDSLALVGAQNNLKAAYNNFFRDKNVGFPKFKSKHSGHQSYTTNRVNANIALGEEGLKLPKLGWVKIRKHRGVPDGYLLKSVTISRTPTGKYFASILYEYDSYIETVEPKDCEGFLGLDFSMKELYVDDNGFVPEYPHPYRESQKKLAREQRKLAHRQKGGTNREKQRIKVARLHEHTANQRKDFLHKQSRKIANSYDAVCIEDLNMKAMSQALNFGKSVSDNGWGMFTGMLAYKLSDQGKHLVKVGKIFPSSKMCSHCGRVKSELHLSERTYKCECGFACDRDRNAAINIRNEGRRILCGESHKDNRYSKTKNRGTHGDSSVNILPLGRTSQEAPASSTVRW